MNKVTITIKSKNPLGISYPIFIGKGIMQDIVKLCNLSSFSKIIVVTDKVVEKLLLKNSSQFLPDKTPIIVLPFGERVKNIECVEEIWTELFQIGADRKSIIINIGG